MKRSLTTGFTGGHCVGTDYHYVFLVFLAAMAFWRFNDCS